jgi:hypothetical protein
MVTHPFLTVPKGDTLDLNDWSSQLATILEEESEAVAFFFDCFDDLSD